MCRLFGMLAAEPITAQFWLLGAPDSVLDQSHRNPDGTGLAHYVGREPMLEKHPIAAHEDREFATEARQVHSHLIVAHIRHATRGEPRLENTQPFVHGSLVFAHNGTIDGLDDLPTSLGLLLGDTDSERYFTLLRCHLGEASDTFTGIQKTVEWIKENCSYTSLNFLLADGDSLYAVRFPDDEELYVRHLEPGEDLCGVSSYGTRSESDHSSGAILFASEKLDRATSWRELEPGTLTVAGPNLQMEAYNL